MLLELELLEPELLEPELLMLEPLMLEWFLWLVLPMQEDLELEQVLLLLQVLFKLVVNLFQLRLEVLIELIQVRPKPRATLELAIIAQVFIQLKVLLIVVLLHVIV